MLPRLWLTWPWLCPEKELVKERNYVYMQYHGGLAKSWVKAFMGRMTFELHWAKGSFGLNPLKYPLLITNYGITDFSATACRRTFPVITLVCIKITPDLSKCEVSEIEKSAYDIENDPGKP